MRSVLDMTSAFNITHTSYGIMESDIIDPVDPGRYPFFRKLVDLVCSRLKSLHAEVSFLNQLISLTNTKNSVSI